MYINTFKYSPQDVSCQLCTEYVKKVGCTALRCPWLAAMPELMNLITDRFFNDIVWARRDRFSIILDDNRQIRDSSAACLFMDTLFRTDALVEHAE